MKKTTLSLAVFLGLIIVTVGLVVISLNSTNTPDLPSLQPVPNYLKVFPEPGQVIRLSTSSPVKQVTSWGIPGFVCAELNVESLMRPGDYFESENVQRATVLEIDRQVKDTPSVFSYDLKLTRTYPDGQTATTGGPFIICWQGPANPGYHVVTITFRDQLYTWWYEIRE